ncbi:MAG TPA: hypothetical protein DIS85_00945 [Vagococcus sp.]|nr:hypothetical protein [Vagococcus sp.]
MLALSEALHNSKEIINPTADSISLDINTTEKGSFVMDLILANGTDLLTKILDLLAGKESDDIQFSSTDVLKVELEISQFLNKEGTLKSEYIDELLYL